MKKNIEITQKNKIQKEPEQYTWIAQLSNIKKLIVNLPQNYIAAVLQKKYKSNLSELYSASYSRNPINAKLEIESDFNNDFGILDYSSSFLIILNNFVVAAIFVVKQAPWENTPTCPFITQIMVHPDHRKLGLALYLLNRTAIKLIGKGAKTVALRVMSDNMKARNLYSKCGFISWLEPLK